MKSQAYVIFKKQNQCINLQSLVSCTLRNEERVTEEYCWAITQAAGKLCFGRSRSSVLRCGF
jgi:hypothetical protein